MQYTYFFKKIGIFRNQNIPKKTYDIPTNMGQIIIKISPKNQKEGWIFPGIFDPKNVKKQKTALILCLVSEFPILLGVGVEGGGGYFGR